MKVEFLFNCQFKEQMVIIFIIYYTSRLQTIDFSAVTDALSSCAARVNLACPENMSLSCRLNVFLHYKPKISKKDNKLIDNLNMSRNPCSRTDRQNWRTEGLDWNDQVTKFFDTLRCAVRNETRLFPWVEMHVAYDDAVDLSRWVSQEMGCQLVPI